jgi:two-component system, NarL family, sensor histidine kinase DevS
MTPERELAEARRALREQAAELKASRQQATDLAAELEETSRGLIVLHAELEAARQNATRLAAIVQWSDDAMFSLDAGAVIRTWNPGAQRLLGYTAAEITGRPATDLVPSGQARQFTALLHRAAAGELAAGQETRSLRRDGTEADVAITCSAIRDPDGTVTGYSLVLHDITARLAAEAELAATRAEHALLAERDRMARDLHDRVIQRIFAAGMTLQTAAGLTRNPAAAIRIETVIADLDTAIAELRETIYTLRHGPRPQAGLRDQIITLTGETAPVLGFTPAVSFDGPPGVIPEQVAQHVLAVCREALSNIARHAGATAATVTLSTGRDVILQVSDNGRGLGESTRASGLKNMRERAENLGGTFQVIGEPGNGTRLEWRVPLS